MARFNVQKMVPDPQLKKEMEWKNNHFSRYILLRYSLALFFFANIYWSMILVYKSSPVIIFPLAMVLVHALASAEQFKLYGKQEANLTKTRRAFQLQAVLNLVAMVLVVIPGQFAIVYPVFADTLIGKSVVLTVQVIGLLICWLNLTKIQQIRTNTDSFYLRFQQAFNHNR